MRLDLHTHSRHSDGVRAPSWVVRRAAQNGAQLIALTDHDTLSGVAEALVASQETDLRVIPGVELSARDAAIGEVHVLGWFPAIREPHDPAIDAIEDAIRSYRDDRLTRGRAIVEQLQSLGIAIRWEDVTQIADGAPVGRPHIARALQRAGVVESVQEAFDRYLHDDGPAYVARRLLDIEGAVRLVHAHGGIAGLAHPTRTRDPAAAIERFAAAGGETVEVWYRRDGAEQIAHTLELARRTGLPPTAGSDWHGLHRGEVEPGAVEQPPDAARAFADLCGAALTGARV